MYAVLYNIARLVHELLEVAQIEPAMFTLAYGSLSYHVCRTLPYVGGPFSLGIKQEKEMS